MSATIEAPSTTQLEQKIGGLVSQARELKVSNAFEFEEAGEQLKTIKSMMKEVESTFKPMKVKADEAKRSILDQEKKHLGPLTTAEGLIKRSMLNWKQEEDRKAEAERQRLQAEADERNRKEREDALKKAAAAKKPETKAKYEEQAANVSPTVVNVIPEAPKMAGISTRKVWKGKIVDMFAVMRFAVEHERWELIQINEKAIDAYAKSAKETAMVPGVQFYTEEVMSASSR